MNADKIESFDSCVKLANQHKLPPLLLGEDWGEGAFKKLVGSRQLSVGSKSFKTSSTKNAN